MSSNNLKNEEIFKIIGNLKGRKKYEEKKATKLGFSSLYKYFENKLLKDLEESSKASKEESSKASKTEEKKNSCSCC